MDRTDYGLSAEQLRLRTLKVMPSATFMDLSKKLSFNMHPTHHAWPLSNDAPRRVICLISAPAAAEAAVASAACRSPLSHFNKLIFLPFGVD